MSYQKLKTSSYCVCGRHQSAFISFEGDVTETAQQVLFAKGVHRKTKRQ